MDFSLNEEQVALRDAIRRFCDGSYPSPERGNPETAAQLGQRWQELAEMGLLGLPLSPELGGSGQGSTEVMLASQELGRSLGGTGFVPAVVMAGQLLAQHASPAVQEKWLPLLSEGKARLSVALSMAEARGELQRPGATARLHEGRWVLEGHKALVLETDAADLLVVAARHAGVEGDEHGLSLFAVDTALPGVRQTAYRTLDGRPAAQLHLTGVQLEADALIGKAGEGFALARLMADRALAAWTAEAVGAMETLLDLTADYLNTRKQFGVPLAKFQALQHRLADGLIQLELCRSMACATAMAVEEASETERRRLVDAAQFLTGRAGRKVGHAAIQLHGGMGMTDECRVGHYVKRLMVLDQVYGNAGDHLRSLSVAA